MLDDLDVRASDVLQSNGIIWVEGPSDRAFINKLIQLWSNDALSEGAHYQCVFYGGKLLRHIAACPPDEADTGVPILRLSRHASVIIDSDKDDPDDTINNTKMRVMSEIESVGGLSWITQGNEIENYIPSVVFKKWKKWEHMPDIGQYSNVYTILEEMEPGLGKRYSDKKQLLFEELLPHMEKDDFTGVLDLDDRMKELIKAIRRWNRIPE